MRFKEFSVSCVFQNKVEEANDRGPGVLRGEQHSRLPAHLREWSAGGWSTSSGSRLLLALRGSAQRSVLSAGLGGGDAAKAVALPLHPLLAADGPVSRTERYCTRHAGGDEQPAQLELVVLSRVNAGDDGLGARAGHGEGDDAAPEGDGPEGNNAGEGEQEQEPGEEHTAERRHAAEHEGRRERRGEHT